ncbi:MAG: DnaD domain protein [Clostridia bacterium]|nr:DnaD domain protein [Clostridia bacterium]
MKLEKNDLQELFSYTELPDVFFTEYINNAPGDYIKVYLYMIFLSKHGKDVKITDLSKMLSLDFKIIQDAIKYWEDNGVITKKNTGYIINNLQEIELHKLYKPKVALSADAIKESAQNQYRARAIENINNQFFQGLMSSSWYSDIELWFKKYGFDEEVMVALFRYCFNHSALHRNYIQTVADAWKQNNIKTFNDLDTYYQKQEKLSVLYKSIGKKLGYTRPLTQYEQAYIEKWSMDYGFSFEMIEVALKRTTSKANPNFDYLDKLISDWHDRGFKNVAEIESFLASYKQKKKDVKELEKKTGYQNYNQRSYDNLDSLYANFNL